MLPPDHSITVCEVHVTQYLDTDGRTCYAVTHKGESPLSTFIGLLELAKHSIHTEFYAEEG